MLDLARKAAALWPMQVHDLALAAHRENAVFRMACDEGVFALRLHRQGYRSNAELASELDMMAAMAAAGISVPQPVLARAGGYVADIDGMQASVLSWLDGVPLRKTGQALAIADPVPAFEKFGALIAQCHDVLDQWQPPSGFVRQRWDVDGLFGDAPQWGRFWDNPMLTVAQRDLMVRARDRLRGELSEGLHDFGLIHADLVSENIIVDGARFNIIDFDDSGYGYRAQDLATALVKHIYDPQYVVLRAALIAGYRSLRVLDEVAVDRFLLIRHLTYLGWIVPRMANAGGEARFRQFVEWAVPMAEEYLHSHPPTLRGRALRGTSG